MGFQDHRMTLRRVAPLLPATLSVGYFSIPNNDLVPTRKLNDAIA